MSKMNKWLNDLEKKFNYCKHIEFIPFPSVSPQFFVGYLIKCKLHGYDLVKEDCKCCNNCKEKCNVKEN